MTWQTGDPDTYKKTLTPIRAAPTIGFMRDVKSKLAREVNRLRRP